MSEARGLQVVNQRLEVNAPCFVQRCRGALMNPGPGIDEGAQQPGPDGALMIGAVAFANPALIARRVARFAGRERAQSQRCPEMILHRFDDEKGAVVLNETQGQPADGENLIWPEGAVHRAGLTI